MCAHPAGGGPSGGGRGRPASHTCGCAFRCIPVALWRPSRMEEPRCLPSPCPASPGRPGMPPAAPGCARTWARPPAREGGGGGAALLPTRAPTCSCGPVSLRGRLLPPAVASFSPLPPSLPPKRACPRRCPDYSPLPSPAPPLARTHMKKPPRTTNTRSRLCRRSSGSCLKLVRMLRMKFSNGCSESERGRCGRRAR